MSKSVRLVGFDASAVRKRTARKPPNPIVRCFLIDSLKAEFSAVRIGSEADFRKVKLIGFDPRSVDDALRN